MPRDYGAPTNSPTNRPRPKASSATPVSWRAGTRSRPVERRTTATARPAGQQEHQGQQGPPGGIDRDPDQRHQRRGDEDHEERAGLAVAEPHGQRHLAGVEVGRDVAQVVGDEDRAGQRADAAGGVPAGGGELLGLHVLRPEHGDQPEEHEHHHLAEPEVPVGLRPAGVEPGGGDADRADQHEPPGRARRQHQAGRGGHAERQERRALDRRRGRCPGADQPHRPDPLGVGAPDAVAVVVGVVHADLQGQADDQGQHRLPPHRVAVVRRHAGAREHRRDRGGQGARPGACHPLAGSRHRSGFKQAGRRLAGSGSPGSARPPGPPGGCRSPRPAR